MAASQWKFLTAIKNWWNPANLSDARLAENRLINRYINEDLFHLEINDVRVDAPSSANRARPQFLHTLSLRAKRHSLPHFEQLHHSPRDITLINKSENSQNFESARSNQGSDGDQHSLLSLQQAIVSKSKCKNKEIAPVVLAHGYGCGGAVFLPCIQQLFATLVKHNTADCSLPSVHVIDWLGCGLSSRPKFECQTSRQSEDFFIESLEQWRKSMDLSKMILCAHSLGAYVCILYAMKYPQYIDHLILISPVGVPEKPQENSDRLPSANNRQIPYYIRLMIRFFTLLWNLGYTPHDILRFMGPKGKEFLFWVVDKRLFRLDDADESGVVLKELLAEYLWHILAMNGGASGEYALNKILLPGAYARDPLCHRIGGLHELQKQYKFDIDFIYGSNDWMDSKHALALKENNIVDCDVYVVNNCGHQLILENYQEFAQVLGNVIVKGQLV